MSKTNLADIITANDNPEEIFEILDLLGQGNYGQVYKALHKATGELVAVKIVPQSGEISSLKKEIIILKECQSNYIVRYYGSYFKENSLWLIIEYCAAGSVIDLLKITKQQLNELQIASIMQFTLKGMQYLHGNRKIHRDIKAGNILLDHKGNAKLADFGVSAQLNHSQAFKDTFIGSPFWMSPEVLQHAKYNNKTDIWSLGITCIELAQGEPPYSNMHPFRAMFAIQRRPPQGLSSPEDWSPELNDFIKQCLQIDPEIRPTADELLKHPFITNLGGENKAKTILSELVLNSMDAIEQYRINQTRKQDNSFNNNRNNSQEDGSQQVNPYFMNQEGTVREDNSLQFGKTMVEYDENGNELGQEYELNYIEGATMVVKDDSHDQQIQQNQQQIQNQKEEQQMNKNKFLYCAKIMEEGNILPDFKKQSDTTSNNSNSTQNQSQQISQKQLNNIHQFSNSNFSNINSNSNQNQNDNIMDQYNQPFQINKEIIIEKQDNLTGMNLQNLQEKKLQLQQEMYEKIELISKTYQNRIQQIQQAIDKQQKNNLQFPQIFAHDLRNIYPTENNPFQNFTQNDQQQQQNIDHNLHNNQQFNNNFNSNNINNQKHQQQQQQYILNNQIKDRFSIPKETKIEHLKQIAKLPFNFQVDQNLSDKIRNITQQEEKQEVSCLRNNNSKQKKNAKQNLPFMFAPPQEQQQYQQFQQNYNQQIQQNSNNNNQEQNYNQNQQGFNQQNLNF